MAVIPGLCQCGCGEQTGISPRNDYRDGVMKGEHYRYKRGHHQRGRFKEAVKDGHSQAKRMYELGACERCGVPAFDRHHLDGDPHNNAQENVQALCRRCHMEVDGRAEKLRVAARLRNSNPDHQKAASLAALEKRRGWRE